MPETKRPLKVFLCHASVDKPKVRELYRYLRRRGINPWFDEEHLIGGQDWQVEIPKALATSDAIIICLTKSSVDKEGYIQKEIKFALDKALEMPEGRIFLIPVKFEECEVPFSLIRYQWVDLSNEAGYSKMMKALKFRASQLERATVDLAKKDDIEEEKLAFEKAERDAAEKVVREKIEREAAEKAAQEKIEREVAEKAAREKTDREATERTAREKTEREAAAKSAQEKAEREAAEKAAREKNEREAAEKAAREKAKHEADERARLAEKKARKGREESEKNEILKQQSLPDKDNKSKLPVWGIGLFAFVVLAIIVWAISSLPGSSMPTSTPTQLSAFTEISATRTPTKEPTLSLPTNTPPPTISPTTIGNDGATLLYVPEGDFTLGYDSEAHTVFLDAFWIDETEVTNKQYATCVDAGKCRASYNSSYSRTYYYGNPEFDNYPVIYVNWNDAGKYCEWAGRRLPSDAEWEKASLWDNKNQKKLVYPWGNGDIGCSLANYGKCVGDTSEVGSYLAGASPYGALDMVGNVLEWVNDWYGESYYSNPPLSNPLGPDSGKYRVLRGGAWTLTPFFSDPRIRFFSEILDIFPSNLKDFIGFRCASNAGQ